MADPVLHIKDSYYFEVPKVLYPYDLKRRKDFPDVWISLDPEYQEWEAHRLLHELDRAGLPPEADVLADWHGFTHADHANFAKPLDVFLEEKYQRHTQEYAAWKKQRIQEAAKQGGAAEADAKELTFDDYLDSPEAAASADAAYLRFLDWRHSHASAFEAAKREASDIAAWKSDESVSEWSKEKLAAYNKHLSGKIIIPQPFGTLRNLYEKESGFAISKFMILELVVGLIVCVIFAQLAKRIAHGKPPKGKLWNMLEVFLVFIRDQIARPSLGGHHEEHPQHEPEHGHEFGSGYAEHGQALDAGGKPDHGHAHHSCGRSFSSFSAAT
jgi:F-type H+-transporting ATPase subunit a